MKNIKIISAVLALVMCCSVMPTAVFAEENTQIVQDGQYNVSVSCVQEPAYEVILPKNISLDSTTKTGSYTIEVVGNIGVNQIIRVVPDETFTLTDGKQEITATITQEKQEVTSVEALEGVTITGTITTQEVPIGTWNGNFGFFVELITKEQEYSTLESNS